MNLFEARKILGVDHNTSPEDIKKAYRKLAMKHHPDRDGGSEVEFKKLQEALEIVEKQNVDNDTYKSEYTFNTSSQSFHDFKEQLRKRPEEYAKQNRQVFQIIVDVTLREAFHGATKSVNLVGNMGMPVKIPAGIQDGGIAEVIDSGNFIYKVFVKFVGEFKVDYPSVSNNYAASGNATSELKVSVVKMLTGGWHKVTTLDGSVVEVRIPAGLEAGKLLKVHSKGYWKTSECKDRGDALLRIVPDIKPIKDISKEERQELLKALNEYEQSTISDGV